MMKMLVHLPRQKMQMHKFINHVILLIENAIPIKKSDRMSENIERTGFKLSHSSHLRKLVPSILEKDLKDLIEPLKNKRIPFSVIFDGTTRVCEAFGMVFRWVEDYEIVQVLVNLLFLLKSMTANDTTREMVSVVLQRLGLEPNLILGFSHGRAFVNTLSM